MSMTRRVLASLLVAAIALVVVARADNPIPKVTPKSGTTADKSDNPVDAKPIIEEAAIKQERLSRQFREFESALLRLKQRLEASSKLEDRDKAVILGKALEKASGEGLDTKFDKLVSLLKEGKVVTPQFLDQAKDQNKALADDIRTILNILLTDNSAEELRREKERIAELLKRLNEIIRSQQMVRAWTERNMDKDRLGKEQNQVTKATADLARGMSKDGDKKDGNDKKGQNKGEGKKGGGKGEAKEDFKDPKGDSKKQDGGKEGANSKEGGKENKGGAKGGDDKENKGGTKGGDPKEGDKGGSKGGDPKEGDKGGSKGGDPKQGEQGGSKGDGSKEGQQAGKPGEGKQGGDNKDEKGGGKEGGQAGEKQGDPKEGGKPGDKKDGDPKGRGDNKGQGKGGQQGGQQSGSQGKSGEQGQSKGGGQQQGGQQGGQQGQSKGGGQQGGQQGDQQQQDQTPGKKQIQDANQDQQSAEDNIAKGKNPDAGKNEDDAIDKLKKAQKALEELLRQLREEEIERLLAQLQQRCERMLAMQIEVRDGTVGTYKAIDNNADKKPSRTEVQRSLQLADREDEIVREATKAKVLLEQEGSAVAFYEVLTQVSTDMQNVAVRLRKTDVALVTQTIEQDIIDSLKEMVEALKKAQKDMQAKKGQPQQGGGQPQDQPLVDLIAQLKMIRSMQVRVNNRTKTYGDEYKGEQAPVVVPEMPTEQKEKVEMVQKELKNLADRQMKIFEVTQDIAKGKNK